MGEYCPGQYSINIEKKIKIIGIAQRIMSNAMYIGGFISVNNELVIKKILVPIYHSLGIDWDIKTAGSIANYIPDINHDIVINAIKNEIGKDTSIIDFTMNDNLINDARIDQATYIS
jgi:lipoate-protein ligase A